MKNSLTAFLFCFVLYSVHAQDPFAKSYYFSPLSLNPSFAGSTGAGRMILTFNDQVPSASDGSGFVTGGFGYDQFLNKIKAGIGINYRFSDDNSWDNQSRGALSRNRVDFTYAQHFQLFDNRLVVVPSFDLGYVHESLDLNKFPTPYIDPANPITAYGPFRSSYKNAADLGGGVLVYTKRMIAGFSVSHVNQPVLGELSPWQRIYAFHMSYTVGNTDLLNPGWYVVPNFVFNYMDLPSEYPSRHLVVPGVMIGYQHFSLGMSYVQEQTLNFMLGLRSAYFSIGYGYDMPQDRFSGMAGMSPNGIHKISLQANLFTRHKLDSFLAAPLWLF